MRILIVDDYPPVRKKICALLSPRADWSIRAEAEDGIEAVEKAKSLRPDVILMDVSMPRMDGIQATKIVRRELPESEVIIVSQNDPVIVSMQAREVGAVAFVSKADLVTELIPILDGLAMQRQGRHNSCPREQADETGRVDENSGKAN